MIFLLYIISSTHVQHKVGSRDEMQWSPYIIGPWVARVPADHAWRTITRADEIKRNGWDECGEMVEWNYEFASWSLHMGFVLDETEFG